MSQDLITKVGYILPDDPNCFTALQCVVEGAGFDQMYKFELKPGRGQRDDGSEFFIDADTYQLIIIEEYFDQIAGLEYLIIDQVGPFTVVGEYLLKGLSNLKKIEIFEYGNTRLQQYFFHWNTQLEEIIIGGIRTSGAVTVQSKTNIELIEPLAFNDVTEVKRIDLSYNSIARLPVNTFSRNTKLERLDLSHNKLVTIEANTFANNVLLNYLDLSNNLLSSVVASAFPPSLRGVL